MGEHFAAVNALPAETLVREAVELAPGEFLREEEITRGFPDDLGKSGGVAEHIGDPEIFYIESEFIHEEIFSMEELTHHGFAADEIAVGFDPHSALDFPFPGKNGFFDFLIKRGIMLLGVGVMLCGGGSEHIVRIFFHECQLGTECPCALADRFADGPKPSGVDMGMSDAVDGHHGSGRDDIVNLLEDRAGGGRIGGIFVISVGGFADDGEIAAPAEIVFRKSVDHGKQNFKIEMKTPDFPFKDGE